MYSTKRTGCRLLAAVTALMLMLMLSVSVLAYPSHKDFISDPDNILSESTTDAILSANEALFRSKEVRIAVCLTDSTDGETISDFSRTLFSKWKMCDGVLLVLDTTAQTYYAVQSVDIDDIVTNTVLADILAESMEEEFSAGNIDRAVMKTVTSLSQFMSSNLPAPEGAEAPAETTEDGPPVEEEKEPNGFVKFMRVVLWLIIIAVILGAGVFVLALFNDDVGDFVRTYVFRKGTVQPIQPSYHNEYYDDRLYGGQNQGRRNPQNPYNPYGRNGQYSRQEQYPPRQEQYPPQRPQNRNQYDPYNDYDMQYRQPRQPQPRPQGQNGQYRGQGQPGQGYNQQGYGSRQGYAPQGQRRPNPNGQNRPPRNY